MGLTAAEKPVFPGAYTDRHNRQDPVGRKPELNFHTPSATEITPEHDPCGNV
ncbi:Beta-lactamase domain protein [Yersinia frederiksenii ATCC 33641]|nr:Beta-lactamase domain protein [Yersinia frederiksenii ATCC 33641]